LGAAIGAEVAIPNTAPVVQMMPIIPVAIAFDFIEKYILMGRG
jgi:hypothetical protein